MERTAKGLRPSYLGRRDNGGELTGMAVPAVEVLNGSDEDPVVGGHGAVFGCIHLGEVANTVNGDAQEADEDEPARAAAAGADRRRRQDENEVLRGGGNQQAQSNRPGGVGELEVADRVVAEER